MRLKVIVCFLALVVPGSYAASLQSFGDWFFEEIIDPITDENQSFIRARGRALDGGASVIDIELVIRCTDVGGSSLSYGVEVFLFSFNHFFDQNAPVVYRVDKHQPVERTWDRATNGRGLFNFSTYNRDLINAMLHGEELVIRISDGTSELTYGFSLEGFGAALEAKSCYDDTPKLNTMVAEHDLLNLARYGTPRLIREALDDGATFDSHGYDFYMAIIEGTPSTVQAFIDGGVDVNKKFSHSRAFGWSPLAVAVTSGGYGIDIEGRIKVLLDAGADPAGGRRAWEKSIYELAADNPRLDGTNVLDWLQGE